MVLADLKSRANTSLLACAASSLLVFYCFPVFFCLSMSWYSGTGVVGLIGCTSLSPCLALPTSFSNKNNEKKIVCSLKFVIHYELILLFIFALIGK